MGKVSVTIFPPERQGRGAFDGGRITEIKPIGFPGEGAEVKGVGPLFYWAWATGHGYGKIGLHPHQAFEIMSYVLTGEIGHRDTLGKVSRVTTGGAQVMQTGSGVAHEEEFLGDQTEMFQIWFEPELRAALKRAPTYREFNHEDFPQSSRNGVREKHIVGKNAPISLVAEAEMQEVTVEAGKRYRRPLAAGRSLAVVAVEGSGTWRVEGAEDSHAFKTKDFSVLHAEEDSTVEVKAQENGELKLAVIEVPRRVDYPLYRDGK